MKRKRHILPIIVISQFACTSLWFAGNGVMGDLILSFNLDLSAIGHLTSAVQLGFIVGTLLFAILTIADRFQPSKVFLLCAFLGALSNLGIIWHGNNIFSILLLRFFTGLFLAGIYPVGMKIAADHFDKGLGKSLGFLLGALVLGTAFPHFLKGITGLFSWSNVLLATSCFAVFGGVLMKLWVPNGPYRRISQSIEITAFFKLFKNFDFRAAAFGYFGHMWELYAFWAFVPVILKTYSNLHPETALNIPLWSFMIIAAGGFSCVFAGYLSQRIGTKITAFAILMLSSICCLISPFIFSTESEIIFLGFLLLWGMAVIADSPMFSTLVAQNSTPELKGTALTIVNCIGFSITIISIQLLNLMEELTNSKNIYAVLALGPILGLIALGRKNRS